MLRLARGRLADILGFALAERVSLRDPVPLRTGPALAPFPDPSSVTPPRRRTWRSCPSGPWPEDVQGDRPDGPAVDRPTIVPGSRGLDQARATFRRTEGADGRLGSALARPVSWRDPRANTASATLCATRSSPGGIVVKQRGEAWTPKKLRIRYVASSSENSRHAKLLFSTTTPIRRKPSSPLRCRN